MLILFVPVLYIFILAASKALKNVDETTMVSNYDGWKTVTVETDTPAKATVMIPDECEFVSEDGWIYIKEKNTGNIIAYQAFKGDRYYDYQHITFGYKNTEYNPLLPSELSDTSLFSEPKGEGSTKYNEIEVSGGTYLAAVMEICYVSETDDTEMLVMVFDSDQWDGKQIRKMLKTYVWGGIVN